MNELSLPDGVVDNPKALEMARIWVDECDLLVSLRVGSYANEPGQGETVAWGDIVADTIKHLSRAISQRLDISPIKAQQEILTRCTEALAAYEKQFSGQIKG